MTKVICDLADHVLQGCNAVAATTEMSWLGGIVYYGALLIAGIIVFALIAEATHIAMEYERGVMFRLGRFRAIRGPGLYFTIPIIDSVTTISLRVETNEIDQQEMITKDSISLVLSAVVFFKVKDPKAALIIVEDYRQAIDQFSLTTLRNVVGSSTLDDVLSNRDAVADRARIMLDEVTETWGVEAQRVEIKQIELPNDMKRAIAREAEAIREKRARIIKAEGEAAAVVKLAEAANAMAGAPGAMEIRRLQTMSEIGAEHNSTIIIGIPQELLTMAKRFS